MIQLVIRESWSFTAWKQVLSTLYMPSMLTCWASHICLHLAHCPSKPFLSICLYKYRPIYNRYHSTPETQVQSRSRVLFVDLHVIIVIVRVTGCSGFHTLLKCVQFSRLIGRCKLSQMIGHMVESGGRC